MFKWKPCPGLSERLFRPIIAQSFARVISFTDDCTAKSSVNGLAVTLDRLISLMRHLYIIWSGVDAFILNDSEKNDDDDATVCKSAAVPILAASLGFLPLVAECGFVKRILTPVRLVLRLERPETAHKVIT